MRLVISALAALLCANPALAAPRVIASVVPVHGIVSAVMDGIGQPQLLLRGSLSEHRASFTTSQIIDLGRADLVFIIGHGLEAKLAQLSGSETVNGKRFVELSAAPGVTTLPIRRGGAWDPHQHEAEAADVHGEEAEGVLAFDPHVWLDPENAKAMAAEVARDLAQIDPVNAAAYAANAKAFAASVDKTASVITADLAAVKAQPYIVFHDAYQYFEKHFGLSAVGSVADVSARPPSAQRLEEIRQKLLRSGAACVFREPQYDGKIVATVIEGTKARDGILDPLGAALEPGPHSYERLLKNLAADLRSCLAG